MPLHAGYSRKGKSFILPCAWRFCPPNSQTQAELRSYGARIASRRITGESSEGEHNMSKTKKDLLEAIARQEWLDQIGEPLQKLLTAAYESGGETGQRIKNCIHGTWLAHPLHPVLTDLPIGAWTTAIVLDIFGREGGSKRLAAGADASVGIGLVGAAGAAVSGLTDWQHIDGRSRRIGLLHGLLNIGAFLLYSISLLLRLTGARASGRNVSLLGYATATAAAYLGGELVYGEQVGVDHSERQRLQPEFTVALPEAELPDSQLKQVEIRGVKVLLVRKGQQVFAIGDVCSHLGCWLSSGGRLLPDNSVICPCHGSRFSVEDGRALDGPATFPEQRFEARIRNGQVEVRSLQS